MPKVTITGVDPRVDGSYELDLEDTFTYGELELIKKIAGVRGGEIGEAMAAGDVAIIVALAKIALDRAGKDLPVSILMDAKVGAIDFGDTDAELARAEEDEEIPPANAPSGANETKSAAPISRPSTENGSPDSTPVSVLPGIGSPASPTGSASTPET